MGTNPVRLMFVYEEEIRTQRDDGVKTERRWPPMRQGERLPEKPNYLTPSSRIFSL